MTPLTHNSVEALRAQNRQQQEILAQQEEMIALLLEQVEDLKQEIKRLKNGGNTPPALKPEPPEWVKPNGAPPSAPKKPRKPRSEAFVRKREKHLMMDMPLLSKMIERAQKKVEEYYFESRKNVLNYDDVMNRQRELIYKERRKILNGVNLRDTILTYAEETVEAAIGVHCPADVVAEEWDTDGLYEELNGIFLLDPQVVPEELHGKSREELSALLAAHVVNVYAAKETDLTENQGEATMRELERWLALRAVNNRWMEHLANMDYLREGIGLRGYEQKDPLLIYQKEAFDEFERMQQSIQDDIVQNVFHTQVAMEPMPSLEFDALPTQMPLIALPTFSIEGEGELETAHLASGRKSALSAKGGRVDAEAPLDWKGGRNDPCWCGSGQKYKKCHGK